MCRTTSTRLFFFLSFFFFFGQRINHTWDASKPIQRDPCLSCQVTPAPIARVFSGACRKKAKAENEWRNENLVQFSSIYFPFRFSIHHIHLGKTQAWNRNPAFPPVAFFAHQAPSNVKPEIHIVKTNGSREGKKRKRRRRRWAGFSLS